MEITDNMVERAVLAHANETRKEYNIAPLPLSELKAIEQQAKKWDLTKHRMRVAIQAALGEKI